jgi:hypothetical protein
MGNEWVFLPASWLELTEGHCLVLQPLERAGGLECVLLCFVFIIIHRRSLPHNVTRQTRGGRSSLAVC